jgi:YD repeat-containing protein
MVPPQTSEFGGVDIKSGMPQIFQEDFSYSSNGLFGLDMKRRYIGTYGNYSDNATGRSMLGPGWMANHEMRLELINTGSANRIVVRTESGTTVYFYTENSGAYRADPAQMAATLVNLNDETPENANWRMTFDGEDAVIEFNGYGQLVSMRDRNNQGIDFTYNSNRLLDRVQAVAPDNRYLQFTYSNTVTNDSTVWRLVRVEPSWNNHIAEYTYKPFVSGVTAPWNMHLWQVKDKNDRVIQQFDLVAVANLSTDPNNFESRLPRNHDDLVYLIHKGAGNTNGVRVLQAFAMLTNAGNHISAPRCVGNYDAAGAPVAWLVPTGIDQHLGLVEYGEFGTWQNSRGERVSIYNWNSTHQYLPNKFIFRDMSGPTPRIVREAQQELLGSSGSVVNGSALIYTLPCEAPPGSACVGPQVEYRSDSMSNLCQNPYNYDCSRITTKPVPGGDAIQYFYDFRGRVTGVQQGNRATSYTMDSVGNVTQTTDHHSGQTVSYVLDSLGRVSTITDALGTTEYVHDNYGNIVRVIDREGRSTFSNFDSEIRLISTGRGEQGTTITYQYDSYDRVTTVSDSQGVSRVMEYDFADRVTTETDAMGRRFVTEYSPTTGTVTAQIDPTGARIEYEYDLFGNVTKVRDERGHATTYKYDYLGRATTETTPLGKSRYVVWDDGADGGHSCGSCSGSGPTGKVVRSFDLSGRRTEYDYETEAPHRLWRTRWMAAATGSTVEDSLTLAHDADGRVTSVTDTRVDAGIWGGQTWTYGYHQDRLTTVTWPDGAVISYQYDAVTGRRTKLTDPDGNTTTYGYANTSTNKGLASVTHAMPGYPYGTGLGVFSYERDSQGRLSELLRGYTHRQKWLYDSHGRLSGTRVYVTESTPLHEETYAYDPLDRRSRVDYPSQHGGAGASSVATRREWGYDAAGRLAREERFPSASGTTADWGRAWGYDGAGNRNSEARYDGSSTATLSRTHNAWNQAPMAVHGEWMSYDDEGNLMTSHYEMRGYAWDRANRLTAVFGELESLDDWEEVYYGYDPSGRLINRTKQYESPEKRYYADGLSPILVKRWDPALNSGAGAWKTVRTAALLPGVIGHVAAEREPSAWNSNGSVDYTANFTDRHYHYDPLGNTVLETGPTGTVLARTDMEAYGEMVRESNAAGTWAAGNVTTHRPRQTTKETDPDTGLRWFGARWYDPAMGSYLRPNSPYAFANSNPASGGNIIDDLRNGVPSMADHACAILASIPGIVEDGGNPRMHCIWNCHMARNCGPDVARIVSLEKEVIDAAICIVLGDIPHCESAFQASDFRDNSAGRGGASSCGSCQEHCDSKGIDSGTAEGPRSGRPWGPLHPTEPGRWPTIPEVLLP